MRLIEVFGFFASLLSKRRQFKQFVGVIDELRDNIHNFMVDFDSIPSRWLPWLVTGPSNKWDGGSIPSYTDLASQQSSSGDPKSSFCLRVLVDGLEEVCRMQCDRNTDELLTWEIMTCGAADCWLRDEC